MPTPRTYPDRVLTNAERQRKYRESRKQEAAQALVTGAPPAHRLSNVPSRARWEAMRAQAREALQTIISEMEAYWEERSEEWQESDRGIEFEQQANNALEALDALDNFTLD